MCVGLQDEAGRLSVLVPNAYVERPKFEDRCFSTDIVMVRSYSSRVDGRLSQWGRVMKTRCFVYQLHESGTFFTPRSLEATMYLQLLLLMCVHMCWARMYRMLLFVCRPRPRTANDIIACTSVLAPPPWLPPRHRDYGGATKLLDSAATDVALNAEQRFVLKQLAHTEDDFHPDAHACRLQVRDTTTTSVKLLG